MRFSFQFLDELSTAPNISMQLKSQLLSDGVIRLFNFQTSGPETPPKPPVNRKKIQVEFIQPFVNSTVEMLRVQANTEAKSLKPYLKNAEAPSDFDIVGLITLTSNVFEGSIALCFKKEVFLKICENLLDETFTEIKEEVEDAAGEILNIIFGMAKAELNDKQGYQIEKAIPTVMRGENLQVKQTVGPTIILPFSSSVGEFQIEIELGDSRGEM